jgi:hypothetical protein
LPIKSHSGDSTAPDELGDVKGDDGHRAVAVLRGAPVEVDTRQVVRILIALIVATLAVLSVTFFLSGLHRNSDVSNLQQHGVSVSVTVTTCAGELGGSGSNLADYRCVGTFILDGQRFHDTIPGHVFRATGSKAEFVTAKNDPGLLATSLQVRTERTTWSVFVLPFLLLVILIAFLTEVVRRRTRRTIDR